MAEVIGIAGSIAGIAGFSGQFLEGTIKLKQLYTSFKCVDREIIQLHGDLEAFAILLMDLDAQYSSQNIPRPPSLEHFYKICEKISHTLKDLTATLEQDLRKNKYVGRVKFLGHRDTIESLRSSLSRAIQSLTLIQMSFYQ